MSKFVPPEILDMSWFAIFRFIDKLPQADSTLPDPVWDGNEICKDITWEDKLVTQEIETYDCHATKPISYHKVSRNTEEVTTLKRT